MRKCVLMTVAASATLLLAGCGNGQKEDKDVTVSLPTEAKADKLDAQGYDAAMPVYSAVYDALVKYDKDKGVKSMPTPSLNGVVSYNCRKNPP